MKKLLLIAALFSACGAELPSVTRPATTDEVVGGCLQLRFTYPGHDDAIWAAWVGVADLELSEPQAGDQAPVGVFSVDEGFEELSCELDGRFTWTLNDATGDFTAQGQGMFLSGTMRYREWRELHINDVHSEIVLEVGAWSVTPCDSSDFMGGIEGAVDGVLEEAEAEAAAASFFIQDINTGRIVAAGEVR
jgi:hypothetical protein